MKRLSTSFQQFFILASILLIAGNVTANCISTDSTFTRSICAGDTFYVGSHAHTQAGNYTDTLTNVGGCDSIVSLVLTVNPIPTVSLSWDTLISLQDLVWTSDSIPLWCTYALFQNQGLQLPDSFLLIGGKPSGGIYTGYGIHNNVYYPDSLNVTFNPDTITYTYVDSNGCRGWVINIIDIDICEGISQITDDNSITLYPSPAINQLYIKTENIQLETLSIYDVNGRAMYALPFKPEIDVSQLSRGIYFVEVKSSSLVARKRFVKM